jgi:hypothetical protein
MAPASAIERTVVENAVLAAARAFFLILFSSIAQGIFDAVLRPEDARCELHSEAPSLTPLVWLRERGQFDLTWLSWLFAMQASGPTLWESGVGQTYERWVSIQAIW